MESNVIKNHLAPTLFDQLLIQSSSLLLYTKRIIGEACNECVLIEIENCGTLKYRQGIKG